MSHEVFVSGVEMIPFVKPGTSGTYQEMGEQAVRLALKDSGATYDQVQQVYAGYVYGDSTCGQAAVYRLGMSGIPIINVNKHLFNSVFKCYFWFPSNLTLYFSDIGICALWFPWSVRQMYYFTAY